MRFFNWVSWDLRINNSDHHPPGSMRITVVKEAEGELVWVKSRKLLEECFTISHWFG